MFRKRVAKDVIENVVNPSAAGELFRGDLNVCTLYGRDNFASELSHEPGYEGACCVARQRGQRVELLPRLAHKDVKPLS
jgi:hypothetical protein